MTDFTPENLTAAARRIALTAEEKAASRERLVSYMEMTPPRAASKAAVRAPLFAGFSFLHLGRAASVLSLVGAVLLSGAGVSYAAEGALPGDTLYPVKVAVNEEVRAALTPSAAKKADWEAERASRRLAEAEALAEKGRLDAARRAEVEQRYTEQSARAKERIVKLRAMQDDGPGRADEVEARLEGAIDAHEKIISAIAEGRPGKEVRAIVSKAKTVSEPLKPSEVEDAEEKKEDEERENDDSVDRSRRNQESDTQDIAKKTDVSGERRAASSKTFEDKKDSDTVAREQRVAAGLEVAAKARRETAVRRIAEVRKSLAAAATKLGADAVADAEARLKTADAAVAEGDALLAAGEPKAAAVKFVAAQKTALESQRLIKARANLKVKVKLNVRDDDEGVRRIQEARRTERTR